MPYFVLIVICLLVGFIAGLFSSNSVSAEFLVLRAWIAAEVNKLHSKLDAILAAVKK